MRRLMISIVAGAAIAVAFPQEPLDAAAQEAAACGIRTATLYTLGPGEGAVVMPCAPGGLPHWMTYSVGLRFIDATGLSELLAPLLARAADLDNPSVNLARARVARAGTVLDECLRRDSLLPPIPEVPTPLAEYLDRTREFLRDRRPAAAPAARRCLLKTPLLLPGTDWIDEEIGRE